MVANRIFVDSFKEEGRYQYGLEIACMAVSDGIWHEGKKGGRRAEIPSLAQRVLLRTVAPELLANDLIGKLFSFAYKWMHVLNLEGNKQWVKTGLEAFFKQKGAKVALSDQMTNNKRSHSIVKIFKKYRTQSSVHTFKNHQRKMWGFIIEINMYSDKDGTFLECGAG